MAQSTERRMLDIFMQPDAVALTPELIEQLVAEGLDGKMLL